MGEPSNLLLVILQLSPCPVVYASPLVATSGLMEAADTRCLRSGFCRLSACISLFGFLGL